MWEKIFGVLSIIFGFVLLIYGPGDRRVQMTSYANTARLLGVILIAIGVLLLKW